jgi:hypothetical protein
MHVHGRKISNCASPPSHMQGLRLPTRIDSVRAPSPRGLSGCDYAHSTTTSSCTRPTTSNRPNCQANRLSCQVSRLSCQSSRPSCLASHLLTSRHADYSTRSSVKLSHVLIFFINILQPSCISNCCFSIHSP